MPPDLQSMIATRIASEAGLARRHEFASALTSLVASVEDFRRRWSALVEQAQVIRIDTTQYELVAAVQLHRELEHDFAVTMAILLESSPTTGLLRNAHGRHPDDNDPMIPEAEVQALRGSSRLQPDDTRDGHALLTGVLRIGDYLYDQQHNAELTLQHGLASSTTVDPYGRLGSHAPIDLVLRLARSRNDMGHATWISHLCAQRDVAKTLTMSLHIDAGRALVHQHHPTAVLTDDQYRTIGTSLVDAARRWRRHFTASPISETDQLGRIWELVQHELAAQLAPELRDLVITEAKATADPSWFRDPPPSAFQSWTLQSQPLRTKLWSNVRTTTRSLERLVATERIFDRLDEVALALGEWGHYQSSMLVGPFDALIETSPTFDHYIRLWGDCAAAASSTNNAYPIPTLDLVLPANAGGGHRPIPPLARGAQLGMAGASLPHATNIEVLAEDLGECLRKRSVVIADITTAAALMVEQQQRPLFGNPGEALSTVHDIRLLFEGVAGRADTSLSERIACLLHLVQLDILDLRFDELIDRLGTGLLSDVTGSDVTTNRTSRDIGCKVASVLEDLRSTGTAIEASTIRHAARQVCIDMGLPSPSNRLQFNETPRPESPWASLKQMGVTLGGSNEEAGT